MCFEQSLLMSHWPLLLLLWCSTMDGGHSPYSLKKKHSLLRWVTDKARDSIIRSNAIILSLASSTSGCISFWCEHFYRKVCSFQHRKFIGGGWCDFRMLPNPQSSCPIVITVSFLWHRTAIHASSCWIQTLRRQFSIYVGWGIYIAGSFTIIVWVYYCSTTIIDDKSLTSV